MAREPAQVLQKRKMYLNVGNTACVVYQAVYVFGRPGTLVFGDVEYSVECLF